MSKWLKLIKSAILSVALAVSCYANAEQKREIIELNGRNTVFMDIDIDPSGVHTFVAAITGIRLTLPVQYKVYVVIASYGGQYEQALILQRVLAQVPNIAVICKYCASAAGMLFAATKVPRLAIDKSYFMMHEMYIPRLTARQAKNPMYANSLIRESDEFNKILYSIIGISKEAYEAKIDDTQWEVKGEELVKLHLADKMVTIHCDPYMTEVAPDTCSSK